MTQSAAPLNYPIWLSTSGAAAPCHHDTRQCRPGSFPLRLRAAETTGTVPIPGTNSPEHAVAVQRCARTGRGMRGPVPRGYKVVVRPWPGSVYCSLESHPSTIPSNHLFPSGSHTLISTKYPSVIDDGFDSTQQPPSKARNRPCLGRPIFRLSYQVPLQPNTAAGLILYNWYIPSPRTHQGTEHPPPTSAISHHTPSRSASLALPDDVDLAATRVFVPAAAFPSPPPFPAPSQPFSAVRRNRRHGACNVVGLALSARQLACLPLQRLCELRTAVVPAGPQF